MVQTVKHLPSVSAGDLGSIPGSGISSREENGNPLQYSHLGNLMDRGAWWATSMGKQRVRHDWVTSFQDSVLPWTLFLHPCSYDLLLDIKQISMKFHLPIQAFPRLPYLPAHPPCPFQSPKPLPYTCFLSFIIIVTIWNDHVCLFIVCLPHCLHGSRGCVCLLKHLWWAVPV